MLSHPSKLTERRLMISIAITGFILIVEVAGGLWTGSLALLSDAAHVFLDIFALVLSYSALRLSSLPPTDNFTFGYHRFEVFASLINGITLALISAGILWEAYHRFLTPQPVLGMELLVIATLGLGANLLVAFILGGHQHHADHHDHDDDHEHHHANAKDANVESALLHVLGDAASSLGVIAAGAIIWKTGWTLADPLAGVLIGIIIIAGSWKVIGSSARILMEGTPSCLNLKVIEENMCQSPGVAEVHDLHIWNLCSNHALLSAHVVKDSSNRIPSEDVIMDLKLRLKEEFGIEHSTLQLEGRCCDENSVCRTCRSSN